MNNSFGLSGATTATAPNNTATSITASPNNTSITASPNNTSITATPNTTSITASPYNTTTSITASPNNTTTSITTSPNNSNTNVNATLAPNVPGTDKANSNTNVNTILGANDAGTVKPKDHADLRIRITPFDNRDRSKRNAEKAPGAPTSPKASLASPEFVGIELDEEHGNGNRPFGGGIDDEFFAGREEDDDHNDNPDVELIPVGGPADKPVIFTRFGGGDDEGKGEDADGDGGDVSDGVDRSLLGGRGGFDVEIGGAGVSPGSIPDVNVYQHKKTLAQGMMDLALLSANANQLRYVLESYDRHPYFYPSLVMISLSLILQVAVGIGLIWNAAYNIKDEKEICIANRINNFTVSGIFLVTVVNVFVSAFGVANTTPVK